MSVSLSLPMFLQFFNPNNTGAPAAGFKVFTYVAGTAVKQATWTDSTQSVQNSNPIILDSNGASYIWGDPSLIYKFVFSPPSDTDPPGSPLRTEDNIQFPLTESILFSVIGLSQTPAEISAGVTPTNLGYPEGDIRRYGALIGSADNSGPINTALSVSAAGGNAAYIPPGTWKITSPVQAAGNSSMVGGGKSQSIIAPQGCDGISFPAWGPAVPLRRVFDGFSIIGTSTLSLRSGIVTGVSPSGVFGVTFSNIGIYNFRVMVYASGFRWTTWTGIVGVNNFYGFYFIGQNTNTEIIGCTIISNIQTRGDGSWGISFQLSSGNTTQSTQILGTYVFGYDINVNCLLGFETQIIGCDLSNALTTCVNIQSTIGGFWLQSCWLETNYSLGGITTGVNITNITPTTTGHVVITDNYINCTTAFAGSNGMFIGNANNGSRITGNKIIGFDQGATLGASSGLIFRDNTINCVTSVYTVTSYSINLASTFAPDLVVGPNYIAPGVNQAASMTNTSANIGVPNSALFPIGSPVQFDATANGFFINVTYFVLTSAANVITVGAFGGGPAVTATGSTAVNAFQAPLPLTTAAGTPSPGFQFFARGSFLAGLTGFSPAVTPQPVDWLANGYTCTFNVRASSTLTGTSNATTMTMTGQPGFLAPVTTQNILCQVEDSGAFFYGLAQYSSANVFVYLKGPGGTAFTGSGTKGVQSLPMTYTFT